MNQELISEIRALREEIKMLRAETSCEGATAELVSVEDPTPARFDELIAEQKRTNAALDALLWHRYGVRLDEWIVRTSTHLSAAPVANGTSKEYFAALASRGSAHSPNSDGESR